MTTIPSLNLGVKNPGFASRSSGRARMLADFLEAKVKLAPGSSFKWGQLRPNVSWAMSVASSGPVAGQASGAGYASPGWVRIFFNHQGVFDRGDDFRLAITDVALSDADVEDTLKKL